MCRACVRRCAPAAFPGARSGTGKRHSVGDVGVLGCGLASHSGAHTRACMTWNGHCPSAEVYVAAQGLRGRRPPGPVVHLKQTLRVFTMGFPPALCQVGAVMGALVRHGTEVSTHQRRQVGRRKPIPLLECCKPLSFPPYLVCSWSITQGGTFMAAGATIMWYHIEQGGRGN